MGIVMRKQNASGVRCAVMAVLLIISADCEPASDSVQEESPAPESHGQTSLQTRVENWIARRPPMILSDHVPRPRGLPTMEQWEAEGHVLGAESGHILLAMLTSEGDAVRLESLILAMGLLKVEGSEQPLVGVLTNSDDAILRSSAAWALARVGDKPAVKALIGALEDADTNVRAQACSSLAHLGAAEAKPALEKMLANEKDRFVLSCATDALARIEGRAGKPHIAPFLPAPSHQSVTGLDQ